MSGNGPLPPPGNFATDYATGIAQGIGDGAVDAVKGLWNLGTMAVKGDIALARGAANFAMDPAAREEFWNTSVAAASDLSAATKQLAGQASTYARGALQDPSAALNDIRSNGRQALQSGLDSARAAWTKFGDDAIASGNPARYVGHAVGEGVFFVGSFAVGAGEAKAAGALGKASEALGTEAKLAKAAVADAGKAFEAAKVGPVEACPLARKATAQAFYAKQGWPQAKIDAHLKGIDFNYPVQEVTIPKGTVLSQWQNQGGKLGNYFAAAEETPGRLGISSVGHDPELGAVSKVQSAFTSIEDTQALKTTASRMLDDWSSPYGSAETSGGGTQYFVPKQHAFAKP